MCLLLGSISLVALAVHLFIWVIKNVTDPFTMSMWIMGILIGTPFLILTAVISYISSLPSPKEVHVKFPLKAEQAKFNKLLGELGEELGAGSKLTVFVDTRVSSISFKKTLPHHILLRGDNDDKSKRSFLLETTNDEITVLLPDEAGVYKYDKKQKYSDPNMPDANMPRYIAEIGDNFL